MSAYLDDIYTVPGMMLRCKASIGAPEWSPGRIYIVQTCGGLKNDEGVLVPHPSARFEHVMEASEVKAAQSDQFSHFLSY